VAVCAAVACSQSDDTTCTDADGNEVACSATCGYECEPADEEDSSPAPAKCFDPSTNAMTSYCCADNPCDGDASSTCSNDYGMCATLTCVGQRWVEACAEDGGADAGVDEEASADAAGDAPPDGALDAVGE
jgi:hypothetical protein